MNKIWDETKQSEEDHDISIEFIENLFPILKNFKL